MLEHINAHPTHDTNIPRYCYYYYFDEHITKLNLARPITGLFAYLSPN